MLSNNYGRIVNIASISGKDGAPAGGFSVSKNVVGGWCMAANMSGSLPKGFWESDFAWYDANWSGLLLSRLRSVSEMEGKTLSRPPFWKA